MISRRLVTLAAFGPSLLVLTAPVEAWARAGGGQGYGGDSSGGYSGGAGSLWGLWPLLFFGHGTGFGTIVLIVVIYYLYQQYTQRQAQQTGNMAGTGGGLDPNDVRRFVRQGTWSPTLQSGVTDDDASGPIYVGTPAAKVDTDATATGLAAI